MPFQSLHLPLLTVHLGHARSNVALPAPVAMMVAAVGRWTAVGRPTANLPVAEERAGPFTGDAVDLKLLVVSPDEENPNLAAIAAVLTALGTPFDVMIATRESLAAKRLWHGSHAHYQGVFLTTGHLGYWHSVQQCWLSALDEEEWQTLRRYETRFGIRQITLSACPDAGGDQCGLRFGEGVDTSTTALDVSLTEAGREIFWYLNPAAPISLSNAWVCPATATDQLTEPLLLTPDGQTVGAIQRRPDGPECLTLTMTQGPASTHTLLLGYGLVNWVTRGIFLGSKCSNLSLQVDDIFTGTRLWEPALEAEGSDRIFRLKSGDVDVMLGWLERLHTQEKNAAHIELDMAFNGGGVAQEDTLTQTMKAHQASFRWINHTFSHLLLNDVNYETGWQEIQQNHQVALQLGLQRYEPDTLVTPEVSGLANPELLQAARDAGVRYLVSDTSRTSWDNPAFNTGIPSSWQPEVLIIPRHPTNLFYNVSTQEEVVAEYNHFYHAVWQRDLTYEEILDHEAEMILQYLLKGDIDPLMFHQANLRSYDGVHSVLADLIDVVLARYNGFFGDVPLSSLSMQKVGKAMEARAALDAAEIDARLVAGTGLVLTADRDVVVPLTGVRTIEAAGGYASQDVSLVALAAHQCRTIPMSGLTGYAPATRAGNGARKK